MDGLTGAYSKLKDDCVPLKERIELSRFILEANDCFFPNKHQVLSDWLCQELHHLRILQVKKKDEALLDVRKTQAELWRLLHEIFGSPLSEHVNVRQKFLPVLFGELTTLRNCFELGVLNETSDGCSLFVFLCCQEMLKNTQLLLLLFNKLENVEQFLAEILACFLAMLSVPSVIESGPLVQELCRLVILVLQQYGSVQRQQVTQRKVFGNLCEKLLCPLLMIKTVVDDESSILAKCNLQQPIRGELISKLDAVISIGLFHKEHMMNYKPVAGDLKSEEPSAKKQKLSCYSSQLFEVLRRSMELDSTEGKVLMSTSGLRSVSKTLPFLLKSFLEAAKEEMKLERSAKFHFLIELYNLVPLKEGIVTGPAIPQVNRIAILNEMLQVTLEYDVYQIAEDNLNDQPLFKWFVSLTESLLQSPEDCDSVVFQSLDTLLKLNHKILEVFLEKILKRCLVKSKQSSEAAEKDKVKVFSSLVETYSKLHQVENLIKCILKVIDCSEKSIGPVPVEVLTKLSQAFERCPLNLTLSLYQVFLDTMKSQVGLLKADESSKNSFNGTAMEVITSLFVTFLCNSSYSASDQHGLDPKKASSLEKCIETTKVSVLAQLIEAFPVSTKCYQEEIGFCALYLLYSLNIVESYLSRHDVCAVECGTVEISWNSKLGTFIPDQSWSTVEMMTKNGRLRFCTDLLAVQRVQHLLVSKSPDKEELNCLLKFLYNFGDCQANPKEASPKAATQSWNGNPCCVTTKNYPVAHWSLVARHAPLLLPHCGDPEIHRFAANFLRTLSFDSEECLQDDLVTVTRVSVKLLQLNELHGLLPLQTALVQAFWEIAAKFAGKVIGGKFPKLANVFTWSCSEGESKDSNEEKILEKGVMSTEDSKNGNHIQGSIKDEEKAESPSVKSVESTTAELSHTVSLAEGLAELMNDEAKKMVKKNPKKIKEKRAAKHSGYLHDIKNLLEILQHLSCSSFTSSNQARCILSLLACDVLAGKWTSPDGKGSGFVLQLSCRLSINTLLQGVFQMRDLKPWRVVDVGALLAWVHATMVHLDQTPDVTNSDLLFKLASASHNLLGLVVKLALKSHHPKGLLAVRDFNDQLLASISDQITEANATNLEIVFTVVSACAEFLQQKLTRKLSVSTASEVIINTMASLLDSITLFLKDCVTVAMEGSNDGSSLNLEVLVLRLSGAIVRAIRLVSDSKKSGHLECKDERLGDLSQIITLVISRVTPMLENEVSSRSSLELAVTCITVLEHVSQVDTGNHRDVLSDEFRTWILRICLEILRTREVPSEEDKLYDAILRLLSTLLEVNDGENCASLLGCLVESSADGIDEESCSKFLTGLSALKKLLANKVVKKRKKDLRPILGKILITMLDRATANLKVLPLVLEIITGVVILGSGTFYSQDLALVFQALAFAREVRVDDPQTFSCLFMAKFGILSWTLYYYPNYVYGVIHVYLTCVRDLLSSLLAEGANFDLATLKKCAQNMARLYQELASHKDVISKYSSFVLSDCIHLFSTQGIPRTIHDTLIEGVHCLFDVCSDDALTRLHVRLPSAERELFRSLKEDFNKHHKFKGNA